MHVLYTIIYLEVLNDVTKKYDVKITHQIVLHLRGFSAYTTVKNVSVSKFPKQVMI